MSGPVPDFMLGGVSVLDVPTAGPALDDDAQTGEFISAGDDAPLPPPPPFVPGVFDAMPAEHYHRVEAMSQGGAKKMRQSPQHYRLMRTTRNVPTAAMQFGTAVHAGVLEPATFDSVVALEPAFNKRTKAGKAAAAEFAVASAGRVILSPDELVRVRRCVDAVLAHPSAAMLLAGAEVEKSLFWYDGRYAVPCKARWDIWKNKILADLKTCKDASPDGFARTIAQFQYHAQAAHYSSGAEHLLDESPQAFVFIAVESEPPFGVACYSLPGNAILAGGHLMNIALGKYADALASGTWPGYPPTIEAIQLPKWALRFD